MCLSFSKSLLHLSLRMLLAILGGDDHWKWKAFTHEDWLHECGSPRESPFGVLELVSFLCKFKHCCHMERTFLKGCCYLVWGFVLISSLLNVGIFEGLAVCRHLTNLHHCHLLLLWGSNICPHSTLMITLWETNDSVLLWNYPSTYKEC